MCRRVEGEHFPVCAVAAEDPWWNLNINSYSQILSSASYPYASNAVAACEQDASCDGFWYGETGNQQQKVFTCNFDSYEAFTSAQASTTYMTNYPTVKIESVLCWKTSTSPP